MKKFLLYVVASLAIVAAAVATVVYRWMQTPYGRLNPIMAILVKLLGSPITDKHFASGDLEPVRQQMNRVKPRVRVAAVEDRAIVNGQIPIQIYTPEGSGPFPVAIFFTAVVL